MTARIILLVSCAACLIGCSNGAKSPINTASKTVCVLFDLSETTNKPEIRRAYVDNFKLVANRLTHGDAIAVALITEFSARELRLLFQHEFPRFDPGSDKTDLQIKAYTSTLERAMERVRDSLNTLVYSVLMDTSRKIMRTDIMTSLQVAERVFKTSQQPRKILVILSDMIEDSDAYNFEREELTERRIANIIGQEKNRNRMPQLPDVKVYVAGASAENAARYERIRAFWLEYFKAAGATLLPENYGAALVDFKE